MGSAPLAALGTVVAGVGFGAAGLGAFGTMAALARPTERGAVFALTYVVSYLAFSVPAVVAGVAANVVGLGPTAMVYGGVVAALGLVAFVGAPVIIWFALSFRELRQILPSFAPTRRVAN